MKMKELSSRSAHFTDSVIRRMTRISDKCGAINLSQGFPDFDPPVEITDRLKEIADEGPHQYAVTWGARNFREALADKVEHFSGMRYDPENEICVTCGSTEAMMAAMMSLVNPGDKTAIFSPFYENYGADTILSGARPVYIPLNPPDFTFDPEVLEDAFRDGVKVLILCNPSNPSGRVFTREECDIIASLAEKYDVYVVTDEVYEHIVYEPNRHVYIASLPGMRERTIVCSSLSKTYSITGWRLGYTLAPPEITDRIRKVHDFLTVGAAAPLMEAAVTGLRFGDDYYKDLNRHYTHLKDLFTGGLKDLGFRFNNPEGAYYVMIDVSEFGVKDDYEFSVWMAENVGVAPVPGSSFFNEDIHNYIRFHFAKKDDTLNEALNRLADLKKKVSAARDTAWR
ncbi:MAG: pyridoxal phosphate-dependent aminotransferase [Anaerovoracaceae bacterium]